MYKEYDESHLELDNIWPKVALILGLFIVFMVVWGLPLVGGLGWWVVLSRVLVTWFLVLFACQCGLSNWAPPPLEVGVSSLDLNAFGIDFLDFCCKKIKIKFKKRLWCHDIMTFLCLP